VPAADAALRARIAQPLVVSVHGGDVYHTARRSEPGRRAVERAFARARLVLANSEGVERAARALGARATRVVHLGADVPSDSRPPRGDHSLVTVGHVVPRKRHGDVVRALWLLRERYPRLRYVVIGDGPERDALRRLASELGVADRVELVGQLDHETALERARSCSVFVMPSVDEAFGVAYVEAMAGGLPAIGTIGEPGPEEIAHAGEGIRLVPPGDVEALAQELDRLLSEPDWLADLGAQARATVEGAFTWQRCGEATVAAYDDAMRAL
jgi:glycosyltransferase involved in cell wall biosynthesis